jgi:2-polyprenyl-3-methyl-5-hydroxy-6-metoxy-1,4-benzoquinol methylase
MKELYDLGIVDAEHVAPFFPRVRDRDDVGALRDTRSGVIFLDATEHMNISHYEEIEGGSYWGGANREKALELYQEDDERRAQQFGRLLEGKDFIDIGCGTGGLLDRMKGRAKSVAGAEPQRYVREELERIGHTMYRLPSDAPQGAYDVAGLFHVFEHITEPLKTLKEVRTLLRPGGTIILEVPHARDVLLKLEAFKAFTLWSEHLVLHTRQSLETYLKLAGFTDIHIEGFQRYPLANHLGWLVDGKPGGQNRHEISAELTTAYAQMLNDTDQTDTLIASAKS